MGQKPDYQIQLLSSNDIELIRSMLNLFGEAFGEKETYCQHQPTDDYLRDLLSKNHFIAVVAIKSGEVVGGLAAYELAKFEQKRSEIYIYDLAVKEAFWRQGIATRMIKYLQSLAADRGAYVIFVQADYGDDPAVKLYERFGKKEDVMHFDIPPKQQDEATK